MWMRTTYARVKCLKDFRVALPKEDLAAKEGEVIAMDIRFAAILEKQGLVKIVGIQREMEP